MKTILLYCALLFTFIGSNHAFAQQKNQDLANGPVGFQVLAVAQNGEAANAEVLQLYIEDGALSNVAGELVSQLSGNSYQSFIQLLEALESNSSVSFFDLDTDANTLKIHMSGHTATETLEEINQSFQNSTPSKE